MAEQCNFVPEQNTSITVKLKSFFYRVIAAVETILHYVLRLEGKPGSKPPPRTFREARDRVLWLFVNYLKETRICRVIVHVATAVKIGECSHPATKESIRLEIQKICESRKKATWLCVEYLKSLACDAIVRFVRKIKSVNENKGPECSQSMDPASLYAHEIMDKMWDLGQQSEETTGNKIVDGAAAEIPTSTAKTIISDSPATPSVRKIRMTTNQQLSPRSTQQTSSSVYNSDTKVTSGNANLQMSTSLEAVHYSPVQGREL